MAQKPTPIRKHLIAKLKIVALLCLYKEWHHFPGYKLFVSLFSGINHICIPAFPFDPPTQSGTCYVALYTQCLSYNICSKNINLLTC